MISVSPFFTAHLVAHTFSHWQPTVPWLVDISDPFSFDGPVPCNNASLYGRLNRRAEGAIIAAATSVAVTCSNTADEYRRLWPIHASKIHIVPHLAIPQRPLTREEKSCREKVWRLTFVGAFDGAVRDPGGLFTIISELRRSGRSVELHIYGLVKNCAHWLNQYKHLIGSGVLMHGPVTREAAWEEMCRADALVNLGNNTRFQLPSKLVDYVAACKPILNFVSSPEDPSVIALRGYDAVLNLVGPFGAASPDLLASIENFVRAGALAHEDQKARWLAQFELPAIIRAYEEQLFPG